MNYIRDAIKSFKVGGNKPQKFIDVLWFQTLAVCQTINESEKNS